jgi:hypothetical protein
MSSGSIEHDVHGEAKHLAKGLFPNELIERML